MARKRTSKLKKYTLSEFKAWLEGVEELQPSDWSPDTKQWQLIRDKINNIVEPKPEVIQSSLPVQHHEVSSNPYPSAPPSYQPSFHSESLIQPDQFQPDMTPEAAAALQGKLPSSDGKLPPEMISNSASRLKTPDIDNSKKGYVSSLE